MRIDCGGSFQIKLSLTGEPDIVSNPTDIVLILDRSGSMAGSPLANLKNGAKKFIDIIDEATDGMQDGHIGFGSRIGIVSFAATATQDTQLITSVADLKSAVDALSSGGRTNHEDAFTKALELFDPASSNARVLVMFTDGQTTEGGSADAITAAASPEFISVKIRLKKTTGRRLPGAFLICCSESFCFHIFCFHALILHPDLLTLNQRITCKILTVQIFLMHIHAGNLAVFIGGIIVNTFVCVAAGSINRNLILIVSHVDTASLLVYGTQDVEKLADAFRFRISGNGIHFCKRYFYKA